LLCVTCAFAASERDLREAQRFQWVVAGTDTPTPQHASWRRAPDAAGWASVTRVRAVETTTLSLSTLLALRVAAKEWGRGGGFVGYGRSRAAVQGKRFALTRTPQYKHSAHQHTLRQAAPPASDLHAPPTVRRVRAVAILGPCGGRRAPLAWAVTWGW